MGGIRVTVLDQTIGYLTTDDPDGVTTVCDDAKIIYDKAEADVICQEMNDRYVAFLRRMLIKRPENVDYYIEEINSGRATQANWVSEIHGVASFKAQPDTW